MTEQTPKSAAGGTSAPGSRRQARGRRKDTIAIIVLAIAGIVMMLGIFTQQKASLPSWLPLVGEEFDHITAEFSTAQAVTPGQGQAVDIAGIQIGKVASVDLEDGHAVVGMDIEPKYMELIHPDAALLLRPKTNLNDMIVEIDPGHRHRARRGRRPLHPRPDRTEHQPRRLPRHPRRRHPPVHPAARRRRRAGYRRPRRAARQRPPPLPALRPLHGEAQQGGRRAPRGAGQGDPQLRRLTTELGRHDAEIKRFVTASDAALGNFANQQASIQDALREFPAALRAGQSGLASSNRFSAGRPPGPDRADPAGAGARSRPSRRPSACSTRPRRRSATRSGPSPARSARCSPTAPKPPSRSKRPSKASATRSAASTPSSTSSPTSRKDRARASSSTYPGSTTTSTPPSTSRMPAARSSAAW